MSVTVGEIVKVLNIWAPLSLKESWDNPGLLIGNPDETVDKVLVTLDVMMDTVDYAIEQVFEAQHRADAFVERVLVEDQGARSCVAKASLLWRDW